MACSYGIAVCKISIALRGVVLLQLNRMPESRVARRTESMCPAGKSRSNLSASFSRLRQCHRHVPA